MAISRFDDIDGLFAYYNPNEGDGPSLRDGTIIVAQPDAYGLSPDLTQVPDLANDDDATHYDGVATVGAMKAWSMPGNYGDRGGLMLAHGSDVSWPDGCTVVMTCNRVTPTNGSTLSSYWSAWLNNARQVQPTVNPSKHEIVWRNGAFSTSTLDVQRDEPVVHAFRQTNIPDGGGGITSVKADLKINNSAGNHVYTVETPVSLKTSDEIRIGGSFTSPNNFEGTIGLFSVYNKALSDADLDQVMALCQTWIDEGAPPSVDRPVDAKFGPVLTNDIGAGCVLQWQYSATEGSTWINVDDGTNGFDSIGIAYNFTKEVPDGYTPDQDWQDNNTLNIVAATTPQSILIRCRATTSTAEITTPEIGETRLTIQAAS